MTDPVISAKIESLARCLARVEDRRGESVDELIADLDRQDVVVLNLTRAVQLCVDVAVRATSRAGKPTPDTMADAFADLADEGVLAHDHAARLRAAVGFRNIAVHAYGKLDWNVVHAVSHAGVEDLRAFAGAIAAAYLE